MTVDQIRVRRDCDVDNLVWEALERDHPDLLAGLRDAAMSQWDCLHEEDALVVARDAQDFNLACDLSTSDQIKGPLG